MRIPESFSGRLQLALKQANLSPAGLGAAVGVDKSVVSRWLSGRANPTQHNLTRIATVLAERLPGFSALAFEVPDAAFRRLLGLEPSSAQAAERGQSLPIPFGFLDASRRETARHGSAYFGTYLLYYWAFSQPGRISRLALILRPKDGLIEADYGAEGYMARGWALLLLNRMYIIFAEERFEAMTFLVLNAGSWPKAQFITGILSGQSEGRLVPTASAAVLVRLEDLSEDPDADLERHLKGGALAQMIDPADAPAAVLQILEKSPMRDSFQMKVPFAVGDGA